MNIIIGLCHVELVNMDTFSGSIIEAIVACDVISPSSYDGFNNRLWKGIYIH